MAIGNFTTADDLARDQIVMLRLDDDAAVVMPDWATHDFEPLCAFRSFASYMRGVAFSPAGDYFVVVTTGGPFRKTLCDSATRWESAARGSDLHPTWKASTGGDTLLSVDVSSTAIFVGGHQRFLNNPLAGTGAGPGAVPRPALGALDPRNGVPYSWNPGRNPRGFGTSALLVTAQGLYIGSDTASIGPPGHTYQRPRVAFFPYKGGTPFPSETVPGLPSDVLALGSAGDPPNSVRSTALAVGGTGASSLVELGDVAWGSSRGAFKLGKTLWYGWRNGTLHRRIIFANGTLGPDNRVNPYHDPLWKDVPTGSGEKFDGENPDFYAQIPTVSGMYYIDGRLYYTRTGVKQLAWREFSPESGIIGAVEHVVPGTLNWTSTRGVFRVGPNRLYYANAAGALRRVALVDGVPQAPAVAVPGTGGVNWAARGLTLNAGAPDPNQPPIARPVLDCSGLSCGYDGSTSSDPDGVITGYHWDFGDGSTSNEVAPTHTYAANGTYHVTLTVTDDNDQSASSSRDPVINASNGINAVGATSGQGCHQDGHGGDPRRGHGR